MASNLSRAQQRANYLYNRYGVKTPAKRQRKTTGRRTVHVRGYCRRPSVPSWLKGIGSDTPF